jgi:hypothetical protein
MPEWLWTTVLVLAAALGYLAFVAFIGRIRKGQFSIRDAATDLVRIRTDVGTFSLNAASRVLTVEVTGQRRAVPFNEIRAVRYGYKTEPAWLTELAFGIDLWDMFSRWTDQCEWLRSASSWSRSRRYRCTLPGKSNVENPFSAGGTGF